MNAWDVLILCTPLVLRSPLIKAQHRGNKLRGRKTLRALRKESERHKGQENTTEIQRKP